LLPYVEQTSLFQKLQLPADPAVGDGTAWANDWNAANTRLSVLSAHLQKPHPTAPLGAYGVARVATMAGPPVVASKPHGQAHDSMA